VQGRFVCEKCAERLKKHTLVEIVVLSGLVALLSGMGIWAAIDMSVLGNWGWWGALVAGPPLAFAAALAGSIGLMKRSNRVALRRIDGQLLQLSEETGE
jgi:membrane protein implicated in regulation of membrane protease activity